MVVGEIAINSHFTQKIDWRAHQHQMRHIFLIKYATCMRDFFLKASDLKGERSNVYHFDNAFSEMKMISPIHYYNSLKRYN